jgi:hypothetical protein
MSIGLFITGTAAPLMLMLSPLSVISVKLVRDCVDWTPVAQAQRTTNANSPCVRPRYRLM